MAGKFSSPRKAVACLLAAVTLVGPGFMTGTVHAQVQTISCAEGFDVAVAPIPPILLKSLKTVPNPVLPNGPAGAPRADLVDYIANQTVAIQLGKALFWDMQAGSDNKTACATCHFQAGADVRTKNQLNPGPTGTGFSPNLLLTASDFPFSTPLTDRTDNIAGSQGVRASTFVSVSNTGEETTNPDTDPSFGTMRQATGMNTPPAINAVFNHRNFWNGRAQPDFNGINPWGSRDPFARPWVLNSFGTPVQTTIRIQNASLASQAVGPPLSDVEMSAAGRTFPDIGKKLLKLKPLGLQKVNPKDSVLGTLANTKGKALKTTITYTSLIQQAFQPKWWNSTQTVSVNGKGYSLMEANFSLFWGLAIMLYEATLVANDSPMDQFLDGRAFDPATGLMTKDGNPRKLSAVASRLQTEYGYARGTAGILNGLRLFERPLPPAAGPTDPTGRECIACHLGANTTSASVENLVGGGIEPEGAAFKAAGFDLRMERMFMQIPPVPTDLMGLINTGSATFFTDQITFDPSNYAVNVTREVISGTSTSISPPAPAPMATYDAGWYNVGVRPAGDNPGVGGSDPFGFSLSWAEYFQQTLSDPGNIKVPGGAPGCLNPTYDPGPTPPVLTDALGNPFFPDVALNASGFPLLSGRLLRTEATDALASFKTSHVRNVELNGPYFHNGGKSTLKQVVEFYDDGADFPLSTEPARGAPFPTDRRSPIVKFYGDLSANGLGMTPVEVDDLVAFLVSLTDERVRFEKAPFDHPELVIPAGQDEHGEIMTTIPAVGAAGRATPLKPFLTLNPFLP